MKCGISFFIEDPCRELGWTAPVLMTETHVMESSGNGAFLSKGSVRGT
jgi:hypothetical protein